MSIAIGVNQTGVSCWCGIEFSVPTSLYNEARRTADDPSLKTVHIYCPIGHTFIYGISSRVEELEKELNRARLDRDTARSRAAAAEGRAVKMENKAAKLDRKVKRIEKGVCPECNRHFTNVARHMKTKHAKQ